jgi:hypothetical protein
MRQFPRYAEHSASLFDRRPGILTITAGLLAAWGLGAMMIGASAASPENVRLAMSQPGLVGWVITRFGAQGFVAFSTFQGLFAVVTAVGVWLLKPWGRQLLYALSLCGVLLAAQSMVALWSAQHRFDTFGPLRILAFGWPLWYLSLAHVKELFSGKAQQTASVGQS